MAVAFPAPLNLYLPLTGGTLTGNLTLPSAGALIFGARAQLQSSADGIFTLLNNAGTDFTKIQLGGTTSSFPAIGHTGNTVTIGLADASDWTRVQSGQYEIRPDAGYTAGGSTVMYLGIGSNNIGLGVGSGVPTFSRAKGTLYLKSDGIGQPYYNNNGTTGFTELLGAIAVNSVSPTSPNRTISINIGGTNYFLAAKTTND